MWSTVTWVGRSGRGARQNNTMETSDKSRYEGYLPFQMQNLFLTMLNYCMHLLNLIAFYGHEYNIYIFSGNQSIVIVVKS